MSNTNKLFFLEKKKEQKAETYQPPLCRLSEREIKRVSADNFFERNKRKFFLFLFYFFPKLLSGKVESKESQKHKHMHASLKYIENIYKSI